MRATYNLSVEEVHSISRTNIVNRTIFKGELLCNSSKRVNSFYESLLMLGDAIKVLDINGNEVWMSKDDLCIVNGYCRG